MANFLGHRNKLRRIVPTLTQVSHRISLCSSKANSSLPINLSTTLKVYHNLFRCPETANITTITFRCRTTSILNLPRFKELKHREQICMILDQNLLKIKTSDTECGHIPVNSFNQITFVPLSHNNNGSSKMHVILCFKMKAIKIRIISASSKVLFKERTENRLINLLIYSKFWIMRFPISLKKLRQLDFFLRFLVMS